MTLSSGPLPKGNPASIALTDYNNAMTQLDNAFPLDTPDIKDNSVSAVKLKSDSVETAKIKDLNVTEPKTADTILAVRHIQSILGNKALFFDDFLGTILDDAWTIEFDPGTSYLLSASCLWLTAPAGYKMLKATWNTRYPSPMNYSKPQFLARVSRGHLNYRSDTIGLWHDLSNFLFFSAGDSIGATPNWVAQCCKGGALINTDLGVPITITPQDLKIVVESATSVKFYIDGVLKYTETNGGAIPYTETFEPYIFLGSRPEGTRDLRIDYVILTMDRGPY